MDNQKNSQKQRSVDASSIHGNAMYTQPVDRPRKPSQSSRSEPTEAVEPKEVAAEPKNESAPAASEPSVENHLEKHDPATQPTGETAVNLEASEQDSDKSNSAAHPIPPSFKEALDANAAAQNSPGLIILQWLTYAFWGWTLLAVSWLTYLVADSFLNGNDASTMLPYSIASVLVLLPLSLICDMFYIRREPVKKSGGATIVMVIHAVIFALIGIGLLISLVFTLLHQSLDGFVAFDSIRATLVTLFIGVALYLFTFLRTLNPTPKVHIARIYQMGMLVYVGLLLILSFVGPVLHSVTTRDDRAVNDSLYSISDAVDNYVQSNHKLPVTLNDLTVDPKAKSVIDRDLIEYKPEGKTTAIDYTYDEDRRTSDEYRYQLCVEYKDKSSSSKYDAYPSYASDDEYKDYANTTNHPAGNHCYKLKATDYNPSSGDVSVSARKL
jgi:hypothetical protein